MEPEKKNAAAAPAPTSDAEGLEEVIAEGGHQATDPVTKCSFTIYEAANNKVRGSNWSEYKFFFTPIVHLRPDTLRLVRDEKQRSFFAVHFDAATDGMIEEVCQFASHKFATASQGAMKVFRHNVSMLRLISMDFRVDEIPGAEVSRLGGTGRLQLNPQGNILHISVPTSSKALLEKQFKDRTFNMTVSQIFPTKALLQHTLAITADDAETTAAYKKVVSGGAHYVSGEAVRDVVREIAGRQNATILSDPSFPLHLQQRVEVIFEDMRRKGELNSTISKSNVAAADEILRGKVGLTGLDAEKFAPITVMWDVSDSLKDKENYEEANKSLKEFFDKKTNKDKISASVKAGYGPFSAKLGYEKEMTQESVNKGHFDNQDEYTSFRESNHIANGQEPRITPRGIDIMERQSFLSFFKTNIVSAAYIPRNVVNSVETQARCATKDLDTSFPAPVGTIVAWHKNGAATPLTLPQNWVECNGQLIQDAFSPFNGKNIPNLNGKGLFLRGAAESGTMQDSQFASHNHGGASGATAPHIHDAAGNRMDRFQMLLGTAHPIDSWRVSFQGSAHGYHSSITVAAHTHTIPAEGGDETRPANMSVVWIIRIK